MCKQVLGGPKLVSEYKHKLPQNNMPKYRVDDTKAWSTVRFDDINDDNFQDSLFVKRLDERLIKHETR